MRFLKYASVGVLNTGVHWLAFGAMILAGVNQSVSNLTAFILAASFGFFVNAKFTFKATPSSARYFLYLAFMGLMAFTFGHIADSVKASPIATTISFSAFSLFAGYLFSSLIFTGKQP